MAADAASFVVIHCETNLPQLWAGIRQLRAGLPVSRVYWHPDQRFRDGRHFQIEIPAILLPNPIEDRSRAQTILGELGIHIL